MDGIRMPVNDPNKKIIWSMRLWPRIWNLETSVFENRVSGFWIQPHLTLACVWWVLRASIWLNIPCWGLHVEHYMFNKSLIWLISRTRSGRRSPQHQCFKILTKRTEKSKCSYICSFLRYPFQEFIHLWKELSRKKLLSFGKMNGVEREGMRKESY